MSQEPRREDTRRRSGRRAIVPSIAAGATLALAVGGTLAAGGAAGASGHGKASPIKIGIVTALTGNDAILGKADIEGLDVAVSQINRAGGIHGHKIKVIQEDDQTSASQATIGFQTLAADHVSAILGGPYNQGDEAMDPLAESSHIPLVELTSQANTVVPPKPYVYEVVPIPKDWAMPLLQYLKASGAKRIAIAYDSSDPFDIQGLNTMKANAKKFGFTVVDTESYTNSTTDFSPLLVHIRNSKAQDVVVWDSGGPTGTIFTKQYRSAGLHQPVLFTGVQASYLYTQPAGKAANGVLLDGNDADLGSTLPAKAKFTKVADKLIKPFEAKYHTSPPQFAVDAYAGAQILFGALEKAKSTSPTAVNAAISHLSILTADGHYAFSAKNHGGTSDLNNIAMMTVKNGKFVPIPWEKARFKNLPR